MKSNHAGLSKKGTGPGAKPKASLLAKEDWELLQAVNTELKKRNVTAEEMGGLLFGIHSHAEIENNHNPEGIVYREKDIIKLLCALGYPKPKWGKHIKIKDFIKGKK